MKFKIGQITLSVCLNTLYLRLITYGQDKSPNLIGRRPTNGHNMRWAGTTTRTRDLMMYSMQGIEALRGEFKKLLLFHEGFK